MADSLSANFLYKYQYFTRLSAEILMIPESRKISRRLTASQSFSGHLGPSSLSPRPQDSLVLSLLAPGAPGAATNVNESGAYPKLRTSCAAMPSLNTQLPTLQIETLNRGELRGPPPVAARRKMTTKC